MALSHSICAAVLLVTGASGAAAAQAPTAAPSDFSILLRTVQIGTEQVAVTASTDGWTITSSGRTGPPLDIITKSLRVHYDSAWHPLELVLDTTVRNQVVQLHITVDGTSAMTHLNNAGQTQDRTDTIDPNAVLIPNPALATYEALAARLKTTAPGSTIAAYQGGPIPVTIRVGDSQPEHLQTVARLIEARRTRLTLTAPNSPDLDAEIWADESGRLLRVNVPSQALEFVRSDVASVSTRRVLISKAGDQRVFVPANGFTLAGTISVPTATPRAARAPAVVLIGGSGPVDRDETVAGIPVLGQLAVALADAGFLVLRYDKRGIGQSGGRPETAGLADFAEDLRAAVRFLAERKDVDSRRIAVIGHSEGGSVALIAATTEKRIAALVVMATMGVTGSDLILAQQQHQLDRSNLSEADKQARIDLQKQIHEAVITGKGWDALPAEVRRQADNAEFQSLLMHDPGKVVRQVRQPILILQGSLDTQVDPANADRLETLARARKNPTPVEAVKLPGVNHLFVPASTGEVDEYALLKDKQIAPVVPMTIAAWLEKVLPQSKQ